MSKNKNILGHNLDLSCARTCKSCGCTFLVDPDDKSQKINVDNLLQTMMGFCCCPECGEVVRFRDVEKQLSENNFVSLGLPSGTLWAKTNFVGIYCLSGKERIHRLGYTADEIQNLVVPNVDDAALPTYEQYQELLDYCTYQREKDGIRFFGPNEVDIFFKYTVMGNYGNFIRYGVKDREAGKHYMFTDYRDGEVRLEYIMWDRDLKEHLGVQLVRGETK